MSVRRRVAFSYLGVKLDARKKEEQQSERMKHWRPTVALCHHLQPDALVLIHEPRFEDLAKTVAEDAKAAHPGLAVELAPIQLKDAWDFAQVYDALHRLFGSRSYSDATAEHFVHLSTGNNRAQMALFLLVAGGFVPARTVHTIAPNDPTLSRGHGYVPPWGGFRQDDDNPANNPAVLAFRSLSSLPQEELVARLRQQESTAPDAFRASRQDLLAVARVTRDPILLMGPTGVGKSTLAREIAQARKKHIVEVNCAVLSGDTTVSELFGHQKGAFTGAVQEHDGFLLRANQGVLFLDEIGDLPLEAQGMLLKAIDEKRFQPRGGRKEVRSEFELIAATTRDLHAEVAARRFRRDLLARIDLWSFHVAGLYEQRSA
ncbi:MAG: RNA repair transcriptional activator RtcR family protein, partial [Gemmatimonadota bacterium]|nr:RNA repair transcriptional activator RtcR family protein [Gemmatimonadota bacterium]